MVKNDIKKAYELIIIGAGPIAIECAVLAKKAGIEPVLIEKGDSVASNMAKFSHLEMFSPWYYNYSPFGIELLSSTNTFTMPQKEYETTSEYINNYLIPLAKTGEFTISFDTQVLEVGKAEIVKTDMMGDNRAKYPFKLHCKNKNSDFFLYSDRVIDTSGVYENPLFMGEGRMAALNEKSLREHFFYHAIDKDQPKKQLRSKTTLMVGATCCAAKSVVELKKLIEQDDLTKIIYINETGLKPCIPQLKNDIFEKRVETVRLANEFLDSYHPQVQVIPKSFIQGIYETASGFEVSIYSQTKEQERAFKVDNIVSNYGFEADDLLYRELQMHECYASKAPMNIASAMLEDTMDCRLTPYSTSIDSLKTSEPGFYVLGAKSYGRNQGFSLHIGIGQAIELFSKEFGLDKQQLLSSKIEMQKDIFFAAKQKQTLATKQPLPPKKIVSPKENRYKTITENLQEIIFETDLKQKITYLSPSWEVFTGFKVKDYIGLDWQVLLAKTSRDTGVKQCNAFMSNKLETYHEEFQVSCSDGRYKWVEVRASVLVDENDVAYGTIGSMADVTQRVELVQRLKKANKELDTLSITDGLTGIYNRRYFNEMLQKEYERAVRGKSFFALVICDIDFFKPYNDTYGHQKGDDAIVKVAKVLQSKFSRQADFVARYGGEEFVALLPATQKEGVEHIVQKAKEEIKSLQIKHINSTVSKYLTMSFGVVWGKIDTAITPDKLLMLADEALYKSKKEGRDRMSLEVL